MLNTKPDFRAVEAWIVHLGAEQEHHRLGVDQHLDALVLDHLVEGLLILGPFHGVFHAGAAAVLDADAQADDRLLGLGHDLAHALAAASVSVMTCGRGTGMWL